MSETPQPTGPGAADSDAWTYRIAALGALALAAYFAYGHCTAPSRSAASPELQAAARMAGARCIGARANSPEAKAAVARTLALNTLAPQGALPPWLPGTFNEGVSGSEVWNALARECPNAPAFGSPFGFPSAQIEKELRAGGPAFAALSEQQSALLNRLKAESEGKAGVR